MRVVALPVPVEVLCGEARAVIRQGGVVELPDGYRPRTVHTDLAGGSEVVVWDGGSWCCAVGDRGRDVLVMRNDDAAASVEGPLERLDLHGGYDPGGMHRVEMYEIPGDAVLVVHELGLAKVSAQGLRWQRRHEDLTARVQIIESGVVWLEGEHEHFGYELENGDPRFVREL